MLKKAKTLSMLLVLMISLMLVFTSCDIYDFSVLIPGGNNDKIPEDTQDAIQATYAQAQSLGYDGTLEEFLEMCKGKDGVGIADMYIDAEGNVIVYYSDDPEFGVVIGKIVAKDGAPGADGKDGIGVQYIKKTDDGNLIFILTDGTEIDIGNIKGDIGLDGVGIANIDKTEDGDLIFTLTDGTVINYGNIDGTDGVDGTDGTDGVGIEDIAINESGNLIVTMTDGTVKDLGKIQNTASVGVSEIRITERKTLAVTLSNGIIVESAPFDVTFEGYINGMSINAAGELFIYTSIGITTNCGTIDKVYVNAEDEIIVRFTDETEMSFGKINGFIGMSCVHEYGEWTTALLPTCTSVGYEASICALCGDEKIQITEKLGHDFGDSYVVKEPSGFENGVQLTACKVCGTAKMEFIDGFSQGLSYERTDKDEYRVTGMGTCTDENVIIPDIYEGLPVTEIGEKAFYSISTIISVKLPDTIVKIYDKAFSECENLESVAMPDAVEVGTDVFRGSIKVEIIVRHEATFVEYKEATCYEPGNISYWWCETCNLYYEDEELTVQIYDIVIPNAHDFVDGVCTKCGKVRDDILIVSIQDVGFLGQFALGTLVNAIGLPEQLNVMTADGVIHEIGVVWNTETYDKSVAGTYTIYGILQSGEFIYSDGLSNTISATVEVTELMKGTADIVFILDISGSMGDEIANVRNNIQRFAQAIADQGISARFSAITYSDYADVPGDPREQTQVIMNGANYWFTDVAAYKSAIGGITTAYGGDGPEVALDGLMHAYYNLDTRKDVRTFYILLTDADYKVNNHFGVGSMSEGVQILDDAGINVSVITSSSYTSYYSSLPTTTGGITADIYSNFSQTLIDALVPIIYGEVIA